jgi:hypothetical protein
MRWDDTIQKTMKPDKGTLIWLNPAFNLEIRARIVERTEWLQSRIDAAWKIALSRQGHLFDGRIFSLDEMNENELVISQWSYRDLVASRTDAELSNHGLNIRPLGVTGILTCPDGIVLGRRGQEVDAAKGMWEAAPAGILDKPDPSLVMLEELKQEIGCGADAVARPQPFALFVWNATGDLLFHLRTDLKKQDLMRLHASSGTQEYSELAVVPAEEAHGFLDAHRGNIHPLLEAILKFWPFRTEAGAVTASGNS